MNNLLNTLKKEEQYLNSVINMVQTQDNIIAPEGTLKVTSSKDYFRYYICDNAQPQKNITYIKKQDLAIAQQLAQKNYYEKTLSLAQKRLKQIQKILRDYDDNEIENLYTRLCPGRQKLVTPIIPTWEQQLDNWINEAYQGKCFSEKDPLIYSEKGERVRSKSEKILADYFYRNNIPYKYEKPLYLKSFGTVYPDFTFLSPITRQEIYWEHEGRMDDPKYAKSAIQKIQTYENDGIFVGDRLILTYETESTILNTRDIVRNVERFLKP